jgi:hypothetical protein
LTLKIAFDDALTTQTRQLQQHQSREAAFERTVSKLGAALAVAKKKQLSASAGNMNQDNTNNINMSITEKGEISNERNPSSTLLDDAAEPGENILLLLLLPPAACLLSCWSKYTSRWRSKVCIKKRSHLHNLTQWWTLRANNRDEAASCPMHLVTVK